MLTTYSLRFIGLFAGCLIAGLLLGNLLILAVSLVPLILVMVGLVIEPPHKITARSGEIKSPIWVGDVVEISWEVEVKEGLGPISLFQEVPQYFALEGGNNLRVFWKGWRSQTFVFSYTIRCTKRGIYNLPEIKWEARHPLGLTQVRQGSAGESLELEVRPKIPNVRRIRGIPGIATSPFPVIDIAKMGVMTTDFREIREYVYGDPVKNINWKATARRFGMGRLTPLVNEYEVEGKKTVWLFLDASSALEVGTDIENTFEYCLEAASSVVYYFLDRGYRVGMYIFNDGGKMFYPDAGRKQFFKISRELIGLKSTERFEEFPVAVEKCRRYILGYNPLCIIVTRLDCPVSETVLKGVRKLRVLRGRKRRKLPVMVISVAGYNVIPKLGYYDDNAAVMLRLESKPAAQQIRRLGALVLEWNPRRESFSIALLRQIKTK